MSNKRKRRAIDGVIIVNKPLEISSNNLLQKIRWIYSAEKAGHTGALDPLATGMLPICFGESTKLSSYLLDDDKSYRVTAKLGERTTTSDAEGEVISTRDIKVSLAEIEQVIAQHFRGEIKQQPSIWSALKYQGKPLYEYARKGVEVPRPIRDITIYKCEIVSYEEPYLTLEVDCSKGTYIRTLIDDLGEMLGCGAYVTSLHRNWVKQFKDFPMVELADLIQLREEEKFEQLDQMLLALETPVYHFEIINLNLKQTRDICLGKTIIIPNVEENNYYRLVNDLFGFIGVGTGMATDRLRGARLISKSTEIAHYIATQLEND